MSKKVGRVAYFDALRGVVVTTPPNVDSWEDPVRGRVMTMGSTKPLLIENNPAMNGQPTIGGSSLALDYPSIAQASGTKSDPAIKRMHQGDVTILLSAEFIRRTGWGNGPTMFYNSTRAIGEPYVGILVQITVFGNLGVSVMGGSTSDYVFDAQGIPWPDGEAGLIIQWDVHGGYRIYRVLDAPTGHDEDQLAYLVASGDIVAAPSDEDSQVDLRFWSTCRDRFALWSVWPSAYVDPEWIARQHNERFDPDEDRLLDYNAGTFSRASEATYWDGEKALFYGTGVPRILPDGSFYTEPSRTNLAVYSYQLDQSPWAVVGSPTVTPNDEADTPFGPASNEARAERLQLSPGDAVRQPISVSTAQHVFSAFLKGNLSSVWQLLLGSTSPNLGADAGVVLDAWGRYYSPQVVGDGGTFYAAFDAANRTAEGGADEHSEDLHAWGAQVEEGLFPTEHIRTDSGVAATRAAETMTFYRDTWPEEMQTGEWQFDFWPAFDSTVNTGRLTLFFEDTNNTVIQIAGAPAGGYMRFSAVFPGAGVGGTGNIFTGLTWSAGQKLTFTVSMRHAWIRIEGATTGNDTHQIDAERMFWWNGTMRVGDTFCGRISQPRKYRPPPFPDGAFFTWDARQDELELETVPAKAFNYEDGTFTRASTATWWDEYHKKMHTYGVNEPRILPDGSYLGESARTNIAIRSHEAGFWTIGDPGSRTITENVAEAPDGTVTADRIELDANAEARLICASTANTYMASVFYKLYSAASKYQLDDGNSASGGDASDEWQRVSLPPFASTGGSIPVGPSSYDLTARGGIASHTQDILYWGLQFETSATNPFPTQHIPTAGSNVTRAADSLLIDQADIDPRFFTGRWYFYWTPEWSDLEHAGGVWFFAAQNWPGFSYMTLRWDGGRIALRTTASPFIEISSNALTFSRGQTMKVEVDLTIGQITVTGATTGDGAGGAHGSPTPLQADNYWVNGAGGTRSVDSIVSPVYIVDGGTEYLLNSPIRDEQGDIHLDYESGYPERRMWYTPNNPLMNYEPTFQGEIARGTGLVRRTSPVEQLRVLHEGASVVFSASLYIPEPSQSIYGDTIIATGTPGTADCGLWLATTQQFPTPEAGGYLRILLFKVGAYVVDELIPFPPGRCFVEFVLDPSGWELYRNGVSLGSGSYSVTLQLDHVTTFAILGAVATGIAGTPRTSEIMFGRADVYPGYVDTDALLEADRERFGWDELALLDYVAATFTRASRATYWDPETRKVYTYDTNVPRILADGSFLCEEARTNIGPWSRNANGWTYRINATVTVDQGEAPNGLVEADRIELLADGLCMQVVTTLVDNMVASCFHRSYIPPPYSQFQFGESGGSWVGGDSQPEWERCVAPFRLTGGGSDQVGANSFAHAIPSHTQDILWWGAQFENGKYPTQLIITDGTAATRAADRMDFPIGSMPEEIQKGKWQFDIWPEFGSGQDGGHANRQMLFSSNALPGIGGLISIDPRGSTVSTLFFSAFDPATGDSAGTYFVPNFSFVAGQKLTITIDLPNGELTVDGVGTWSYPANNLFWKDGPTAGLMVGHRSGAQPFNGRISRPRRVPEAAIKELLDYSVGTFARASTATWWDEVLKEYSEFAINEARILSDGSFVAEVTRTNAYRRTEELDDVTRWEDVNPTYPTTVTADAAEAPDGTTTAERVQVLANGGWFQNYGYASVSGASYVNSVFMKRGTLDAWQLVFGGAGGVTIEGALSGLLSGWSRKMNDFLTNHQGGQMIFDGRDLTSQGGIAAHDEDNYIWGAQGEASFGIGIAPSSYIPCHSVTARVTRALDDLRIAQGDWPEDMRIGKWAIDFWPEWAHNENRANAESGERYSTLFAVDGTPLVNGLRAFTDTDDKAYIVLASNRPGADECVAGPLEFDRNQKLTITVDMDVNSLTIGGATSGNGIYFGALPTTWEDGELHVGHANGAQQLNGKISRPRKA